MEENKVVGQPQTAQGSGHEQHKKKEEGKRSKQFKEGLTKFKRFAKECRRVLKVTQKPNKDEFITTAKVSALGLGAIGLIGFLLTMMKQLLF